MISVPTAVKTATPLTTKKRARTEEEETDVNVPAAKRPKPSTSSLYIVLHKQVDDDYKQIVDYSDVVLGQYATYRLALAYKYQAMVDIFNDAILEREWHSIAHLPTLKDFGHKATIQPLIETEEQLGTIYSYFFVDPDAASDQLELNYEVLQDCLASLKNEINDAAPDVFEEKKSPTGHTFSDLFELLFQCEFRNQSQHTIFIETRTTTPSSTEWPPILQPLEYE